MVKKVFAALFALSLSATAMAQDTSLTLSTAASVVGPGDQFVVEASIVNNAAAGVFGWSIAVAHDGAALSLDMVEQGDIDVAFPAPGFPPAFAEVTAIDNATGTGWINATILSLTETFFFDGGTTNVISRATYTNNQTNDGDISSIAYTDGVLANLPSPPVAIGVSLVGGTVVEFGNGLGDGEGDMGADLDIETEVPPPFQLTAGSENVTVVLGSGAVEAAVGISASQINPLLGDAMAAVDAATIVVEHDDAQVEVTSADPAGGVMFAMTDIQAGSTTIMTMGFTPDSGLEIASLTYAPAGMPMLVGGESFSSALTFGMGTDVTAGGGSVGFETVDGSVTINAVSTIDFIRGDCNDDGLLNIADAITIIQGVVAAMGSGSLSCSAACDADGDGMIALNDAILTLAFTLGLDPADLSVFAPGAAVLADPGTSCGQFMGQTPEDCDAFTSCP